MNLRVSRAIFLRHLRFNLHIGHRVFDAVALPVLDVLLWGFFALFVAKLGVGSLPAGLVAAILFWTLLQRFQESIGLAFQDESGSRNILNILTAPVRFRDYLCGVVGWGVVRVAAGWLPATLIAVTAFGTSGRRLAFAMPVLAAILAPLAVALAIVVLGMILRFGDGAGQLTWYLGSILLPLSAAFYPVSALPAAIRAVSVALPSTHAFEALRSILAGTGVPVANVLAGLVLDAVFLAGTVTFARSSLGVWRRNGHASRYL